VCVCTAREGYQTPSSVPGIGRFASLKTGQISNGENLVTILGKQRINTSYCHASTKKFCR